MGLWAITGGKPDLQRTFYWKTIMLIFYVLLITVLALQSQS